VTESDRTLYVKFGALELVIRFSSDEEVARAKRGMMLIGTPAIRLNGHARAFWDTLTPERRARIERDADWLNDKITAAKLELSK
jgi:hypothetical protein